MRMSYSQRAFAGGCSAGVLAPFPAMQVFIRPAVKLHRWPGQTTVLETGASVERITVS
jgi:hypothetical protein